MSTSAVTAAPVQSASPDSTTPSSGRNVRGHFAPGNPGGPGRPPKVEYIEREIVAIMASALTAETWVEIVEAVIKKACEGNMTAVQWLSRTFLSGKLNAAAAADEVRVPVHVEMFELGKKQHREWSNWVEQKQRERAEAEEEEEAEAEEYAVESSEAAAPAPMSPARQDQTSQDQTSQDQTSQDQTSQDQTTQDQKRTETVVPVAPAAASTASPPSLATPAPTPTAPRTVPPAERVFGFRVTKGAPPANGRNRSKAAKNGASAGPCAAS